QIAANVAHNALWRASGPGRIENVERVGGGEIGARRAPARRARRPDKRGPVLVSTVAHPGFDLRALIDETRGRLVPGERNREIEQRLVFDDPARLPPARPGHTKPRLA